MIEHVVLSWSDGTATESQQNTTNVDVANEFIEEDINGSPFDFTRANLESCDNVPTERPPISDQVNETIGGMSDTNKFTMRQPEKEEQAAVQSIPCETAKNVSVLRSVESHLTEEPLENDKQDFTSVQNDRSNQKCQTGKFKDMCHMRPIH